MAQWSGGAGALSAAAWPSQMHARTEALISAIVPSEETDRQREGVQHWIKGVVARALAPYQVWPSTGVGTMLLQKTLRQQRNLTLPKNTNTR